MISISLCMIVKNEEDVLARCLDSVKALVDEIIIVDTGSTDQTVEIAKAYTEKVFHFPWIDDFAAARNESFSKASSEYILWLDADDVLLEKDRESFLELKRTLPPDVDMVMMKYNLAFDKDGNPTFSSFRERLLRRSKGFQWVGPVHEVIVPEGGIVHAGHIAVSHLKTRPSAPDRNLKIMEKHIASGGALDPRQTFYYGRELKDNRRMLEAIAVYEGFLEEGKGWIENNIQACRDLALCYAALGKTEERLGALLKSFHFDTPRAEICCDIGKWFLEKKRFAQAAYWYEQARGMKPAPERGGFLLMDCYGYIPCIELCVCYDRLGMREKAKEMNERAAAIKPGDAAVEYNRRYFEGNARSNP